MAPYLERRSAAECLTIVNAYLKERHPKELPISIDTLYDDRNRGLQLIKEQSADTVTEHLAEYDHAIAEAWVAFRQARGSSLNRSAYISTIGALIEKKAKLDGSLREQASEPAATVNVLVQVKQILSVLPPEIRTVVAEQLDRLEGPTPAA
jgi:hypothetical protein